MYLPRKTEQRDLYKRVLNTIYLDLSAGSEETFSFIKLAAISAHHISELSNETMLKYLTKGC